MKHALIYIGIVLSALSCVGNRNTLQSGDLLFQAGKNSEFSGAIVSATGDDDCLNFTHVGITVCCRGADSVLEATTEGGVRMTALSDFLARSHRIDGRPAVVVKRLKDTAGVTASIARARACIGQPYDYSFRPHNGRMYCSELVHSCYLTPAGDTIFSARPMNFRAADGTMPHYWIALFEKLGEPVPEGLPGSNPNDMAREEPLKPVFRFF